MVSGQWSVASKTHNRARLSRVPVVHGPGARRTRRISKGRDSRERFHAGSPCQMRGLAPDANGLLGGRRREGLEGFATAARWWAEVPAMNPTLYAVPRPSGEAFHRLRGPSAGDAKTLRKKKPAHKARACFLLSTSRIAN